MEVFKSLWRPRGNIAIPDYGASDGVDLQVKALLYMYKRLGIARSGDRLERQPLEGIPRDDIEQLDKLYNIDRFEHVVFDDPHRVLIDWPKNRFRAMLLLPHMPQMEHLPKFRETHFHFSVLEADASADEYIRTLALSDIYVEHTLPPEIRREIAASVVKKYQQRTLEERALIILEYLRLVAKEIQVARIYKAMLGKMQASPHTSPHSSPHHSPHHSPQHSPQLSPQHSPQHPTLHARSPPRAPSPGRQGPSPGPKVSGSPPPLRPSSPSRFPRPTSQGNPKLQSATPKLRPGPGSAVHSPQGSPSPSPPGSPTLSTSPTRLKLKSSQANLRLDSTPSLTQQPVGPSMDAGKKYILHQARLAVQTRIDKEKAKLQG